MAAAVEEHTLVCPTPLGRIPRPKVTYNNIFAAYVLHRNGILPWTNVTVTNVANDTVVVGSAANPPPEDRSDHRTPISNGLRGNYPSGTAPVDLKAWFRVPHFGLSA